MANLKLSMKIRINLPVALISCVFLYVLLHVQNYALAENPNLPNQCLNTVTEQMKNLDSSLNKTRAEEFAIHSGKLRSALGNYKSGYSDLYNEFKWNHTTCKVEWGTVNVAIKVYNGSSYLKTLVVTLDPSISRVLQISEQHLLGRDFRYELPPYRQFEAGVPIEEITCENHLELFFKSEDGSPLCLTEDTGEKLASKEWITRQINVSTSLCQNATVITNKSVVLIACNHPSATKSLLKLPSPVYKRELNNSTYGMPSKYYYQLQIPTDLLSSSQREQIIGNVTQQLPEAKSWPDGWKVQNFIIQATGDRWYADIQFVINAIWPTTGQCGWHADVTVDLQTLIITNKAGTNVASQRC